MLTLSVAAAAATATSAATTRVRAPARLPMGIAAPTARTAIRATRAFFAAERSSAVRVFFFIFFPNSNNNFRSTYINLQNLGFGTPVQLTSFTTFSSDVWVRFRVRERHRHWNGDRNGIGIWFGLHDLVAHRARLPRLRIRPRNHRRGLLPHRRSGYCHYRRELLSGHERLVLLPQGRKQQRLVG